MSCPYLEPGARADARASSAAPVRLAVAGKGGSGKTTIAGTIARLLARRGREVVAIDGDTNPNLSVTLGLPGATELTALPNDLLVRRQDADGSSRTELDASAARILERYGARGPEGLRLLVMGRVDHAGAG